MKVETARTIPSWKVDTADQLAGLFSDSTAVLVADPSGIDANSLRALRAKSLEYGVVVRIARNTLARRAVQDTSHDVLEGELLGPTLLAFSKEEPSAAARLFTDFIKETETEFGVRAISLDGSLYEGSRLTEVSKLPTASELQAKVAGLVLQPLVQNASALKDLVGKLARAVSAVSAKQADG